MERDIKQSNASMVGGTGGSLGGATASDLERGFTTCDKESAAEERAEEGEMDNEPMEEGFVGRPMGWDR